MAQVGLSGVSSVEVAVDPASQRNRIQSWRRTEILGPPENWGGGMPAGKPPGAVRGLQNGIPVKWPMRYAIAHWICNLKIDNAGTYMIRCRTIDDNGIAQPMPRPLPKSGMNAIEEVEIVVRR